MLTGVRQGGGGLHASARRGRRKPFVRGRAPENATASLSSSRARSPPPFLSSSPPESFADFPRP
jgi:hypothetical protein